MVEDASLLVVDDEDVICRACRRILSPQGFRVETSNDAREGLRLATQKDYAAILLDIKMPLMDGIEFLQELRKTKPDVPVIIITGYPSKSSVASAKDLGAADYVAKPFTPEAITRAVQKSLRPGELKAREEPRAVLPSVPTWSPAVQEFRYWNESWLQLGKGGTARVGVMLPPTHHTGCTDDC